MFSFVKTNVGENSKGNWRTRDIFVGVLDQQERKRRKKKTKKFVEFSRMGKHYRAV